jgi:DNA-binding XRE family transcriptional regulator
VKPRRELLPIVRRLREKRIALKITQEELAETIGIAKQTLQRIEWGESNPSSSTLCSLCRVLGEQSPQLEFAL